MARTERARSNDRRLSLPRTFALLDGCMALMLDAERLLEKADALRLFAINAQLLATRAGAAGAAFQALARETVSLSQDARAAMAELRTRTKLVATGAVRAALSARHDEKYALALDRGAAGEVRARLRAHMDESAARTARDRVALSDGLRAGHLALAEIDRMHVQLAMIATMMNIEASRLERDRAAIGATARSLVELERRLSELIARLRARSQKALESLAEVA